MSNINPTSNDSVKAVLMGAGNKKHQSSKGKWLLALLVAGIVAGGAGYYFLGQSQTSTRTSYKTTEAKTRQAQRDGHSNRQFKAQEPSRHRHRTFRHSRRSAGRRQRHGKKRSGAGKVNNHPTE